MLNKFSWMKFVLALVFVGGLFFLLVERKPKIVEFRGETMGTTFSVKYLPENNPPEAHDVKEDVLSILDGVNNEMSTYRKESIISQFNKRESLKWMEIPRGMADVLNFSLELARKTDGAFDPTLGPLVNLWGFGPDGERQVPSEEVIKKTREYVGFNKVLEFSFEESKIRKIHPKAYLDLSATAKGFGVDRVSAYLYSQGLKNHFVEIGGEVRTRGRKDSGPWKVGIEVPAEKRKAARASQKVISLNEASLATSGSYRNYFVTDGEKYQHTIDAETGKPVKHNILSVSVLHEGSCLEADGWATALMALGLEKGLALAESEGLAAYFIAAPVEKRGKSGRPERNFVEKATSAFKARFEVEL